jgi:hypothetical protein
MRYLTIVATVLAIAMLDGPLGVQAADPNDFPTYSNLGRYQNIFQSICGRNKVDTSPTTIPSIGCFAIKAGGSLQGTIGGHTVSIRLDANSNETLNVDGVEIQPTGSSTTNHPLVQPTAAGFAFCSEAAPSDCPIQIFVLTRRPGDFASFDISRQFKPHSFVTNQENWDDEQERIQPVGRISP